MADSEAASNLAFREREGYEHDGRASNEYTYNGLRVLQTALVVLVLFSMVGSMVSGIILSRHALIFLPIHGGTGWARTVHLLCGYWGFVLMGLHLGLHWSVMLGIAGKSLKTSTAAPAPRLPCTIKWRRITALQT